jgi:hypothetical protein
MFSIFNSVSSSVIAKAAVPPPSSNGNVRVVSSTYNSITVFFTNTANFSSVNANLTSTSTNTIPDFYLPLDGNLTNYGNITTYAAASCKVKGTSAPPSSATATYSNSGAIYGNSFICNPNFINIDNNITNNLSNFTISSWVYITSYGGSNNWFCARQDSGRESSCGLYVNASGFLAFYATNTIIFTSSSTVPLNTWTHVAVVINNTSSPSRTLYINGVPIASDNTATGTIPRQSTDPYSTVGTIYDRLGNGTYNVLGRMQDFRFYKTRALSNNEIASLYTNRSITSPGYSITYNNLTGSTITFGNLLANTSYNIVLSNNAPPNQNISCIGTTAN